MVAIVLNCVWGIVPATMTLVLCFAPALRFAIADEVNGAKSEFAADPGVHPDAAQRGGRPVRETLAVSERWACRMLGQVRARSATRPGWQMMRSS